MATTMRRSYSIALNNRRHFRMLRAADTGTTFTTDRKLLRDIVFHVYGTYCIEHPEEESVFYHPFRNKCFKQYFTIPRCVTCNIGVIFVVFFFIFFLLQVGTYAFRSSKSIFKGTYRQL